MTCQPEQTTHIKLAWPGLGTRWWVLAADVGLVLDAPPRVCAPDVATAAPFPGPVSPSTPKLLDP